MNFDLTDDQEALVAGIRALTEGRFGRDRIRAGFDRGVWDDLAAAGVLSLLADGFTVTDATLVFEELGRAIVPGPFVWGLLAHGTADGVVTGIDAGRPSAATAPVLVEHLGGADALVVLAPDAVHLVPAASAVGEDLARPFDPLTPVTRLPALPALDGATRVGGPEEAATWRDRGTLLTAALLAGIALRVVELATDHALAREQFGRPVGSFQAVKHLLADARVRAEVARTAVHAAAVTLDDPSVGDLRRALAGAKALAGEAATTNARVATQVHGGMGYTWEVDVHLYLKRAWVLGAAFGTTDEHLDGLGATLGA